MYAYIRGRLTFTSPAVVVIETGGVGYELHISLQTYTKIQNAEEAQLFTYLYVKEDVQALYGFAEAAEKTLFTQLLSVSGIGPNTARMVLSSFSPEEIRQAILREDEALIRSIKGIGPKSAKRLILELKDKLTKTADATETLTTSNNTGREEALSALIMLGFSRQASDKALRKVQQTHPDVNAVEQLIKLSLKEL